MKKILIITSLYPNTENSTRGIFVQKQIEELSSSYQIIVFATEISQENKFSSSIQKGIEVFQTRYSFPKFVVSPFYYEKAIKNNLLKIIAEFKPDVIHIHAYQHIPELLVLSRILDFSIQKVVVTFHNNKQIADISNFMKYYYRATLKKVLQKFSDIIVVSDKVKKILQPYLDDPTKINVIGNGVETDYPSFDKNDIAKYLPIGNTNYNIISVGNLVPKKGFDLLIQAVSDMIDAGEKLSLSIIGAGPELSNLEEMISDKDMQNHIRLLGRIDHDIVMNMYKYFDAFVLPSWSETFGIVYLEAMLAKLPVIGIKGEGIDGIVVDGENGYLVSPNDLDELKNKITKIINLSITPNISERGYETVMKDYRLESIVNKIKDIYER